MCIELVKYVVVDDEHGNPDACQAFKRKKSFQTESVFPPQKTHTQRYTAHMLRKALELRCFSGFLGRSYCRHKSRIVGCCDRKVQQNIFRSDMKTRKEIFTICSTSPCFEFQICSRGSSPCFARPLLVVKRFCKGFLDFFGYPQAVCRTTEQQPILNLRAILSLSANSRQV